MLGLFTGKRLEVISDGARWIAEWIASFQGVETTRVLCWCHLQKRIYEAMGAVGLAKDRRKELEHEILGHLWRGELSQAVWILWGLRSTARIPKRMDDLIGYLLRKKRWIVNYCFVPLKIWGCCILITFIFAMQPNTRDPKNKKGQSTTPTATRRAFGLRVPVWKSGTILPWPTVANIAA